MNKLWWAAALLLFAAGCTYPSRVYLERLESPALFERMRAVQILGDRVREPAVFSALCRHLASDQAESVQLAILEAFRRRRVPAAARAVQAAAASGSLSVQVAAIQTLIALEADGAVSRLAALYEVSRRPRVRCDILAFLGRKGRLDILRYYTDGDDDGDGRTNEDPPDRAGRDDDGDDRFDEDGFFGDNRPAVGGDLELRLELGANSYAASDPLLVTVQLTNRGPRPVKVGAVGGPESDYLHLQFYLAGVRDGDQGLVAPLRTAPMQPRALRTVAPLETIVLDRVDLTVWYFRPVPGDYRLRAVYYTGASINREECEQRQTAVEHLISNCLTFTITE